MPCKMESPISRRAEAASEDAAAILWIPDSANYFAIYDMEGITAFS